MTDTRLHRAYSADGTEIAGTLHRAELPLVLVHGSARDHTRWEPVRPALAEHFIVSAMDWRGRGYPGS
jgi:pimeloyl-ACP methyl ester carboxylesterase